MYAPLTYRCILTNLNIFEINRVHRSHALLETKITISDQTLYNYILVFSDAPVNSPSYLKIKVASYPSGIVKWVCETCYPEERHTSFE